MASDKVSFVSPAGVKLSGPPGLLEALVGIQANESGWDYFRAQGSPGGSIEPDTASVGGGYGAYQFQVGTSQYDRAAAAGWSPAVQDQIAAEMMTGYWNTWHSWQDVAEAWYGPGTVPQVPIAANSQQDVSNVLAAEGGHAPLPAAWVFGDYKGGLTSAQVKAELGGGAVQPTNPGGTNPSTPATLDSFSLNPLNWGSDIGKSLLPLLLEGAFVALGAALVVVGGYLAAGKPAKGAGEDLAKLAVA